MDSSVVRTSQPIVAAQGLTKVFKDFWMRDMVRAVDSLDLEIRPQEVFGLLGPNGSGKSTTIKLILGLLHKTSGRLAVFGKDASDVAVKKRIGFLPEESYLYPFLNARETLDLYGKLFRIEYRARKRRIDELLDMVGLAHVQHRQMHEYSKGMQRRIGIAQALINDPDFLILDEPTTGLDPLGTRQIKDLIIELGRRGKTVLLSSHLLADVEDCVDRLVILYGGKKRAQGTCDELLVAADKTTIETVRLNQATIARIDQVIREEQGAAIEKVSQPRQTLEQVFLDIVEQARAEHIETGGVEAGGPTAAFLRGQESVNTTGRALIEELLTDDELPPMPVESDRPAEPLESAEDQGEAIVEALLNADETPTPPTTPTTLSAAKSANGGPTTPTAPDATTIPEAPGTPAIPPAAQPADETGEPSHAKPDAPPAPLPDADIDMGIIESLTDDDAEDSGR
ncbi:MAG: ABC transporter ATP-binding protein [Phycisphaerales bacterium]|nr:ABC transporter ATP-binding protein [Phycisphaerales bacterium]